MRNRLAVFVAAAATALAAAGAASAAAAVTPVATSLTGSIAVSWQGDPARGCAAAGLCGVSGTASGTVPDRNDLGQLVVLPGLSGADDVTLAADVGVRVVRPGGATCSDVLGLVTGGGPRVLPARGGVRIVDGTEALGEFPTAPGLLDAGHCAGPVAGDLAGLLPSAFVPEAQLRKGTVISLATNRAFGAGPFSGTMSSTLRLGLRLDPGARQNVAPTVARSRGRSGPTATIERRFAIVASRGGLVTTFAGAPAPLCAPLDACGLSGTITLADLRGGLELTGRGSLPAGHPATVAEARHLFASGAFQLALLGTDGTSVAVSEVASRQGAPTCQDSVRVPLPPGGTGAAGEARVSRV